MERWARKVIFSIAIILIALGSTVVIWEAIPGILKVLIIIGVIFAFIGIFKKR